MCNKIDSEEVIMRYFDGSQKDKLTFRQLNKLRERIESDIKQTVFVDVTYSSLRKVVVKHQNEFSFEEDGIRLTNSSTIKYSDYYENEELQEIFPKILISITD